MGRLALATLLCFCVLGKLLPSMGETLDITPGKCIHLTDENFDAAIGANRGVWLVVMHAPWCSHCKALDPAWTQLAKDLKDHRNLYFAKINGVTEKGLLSRFGADEFPTIYALEGLRAWKYEGSRDLSSLKDFALGGYKQLEPLPSSRAPNSIVGRLFGLLHRVPRGLKAAYAVLRDEYKWSNFTIFLAVLAIPVVTGTVTICFLDGLFIRKSRRRYQGGGQLRVAPMMDSYVRRGEERGAG